jgi:hypothetical protein
LASGSERKIIMTMKKYKVEVDTTTGGSYPLEKTFKSPDYAATFLQGAVTRGDFLPTTLSSYVNAKLIVSFRCYETEG